MLQSLNSNLRSITSFISTWHLVIGDTCHPIFPPWGREKVKIVCNVSTVLQRHVDVICHVALLKPMSVHHASLIETNYIAPHVHLEDSERKRHAHVWFFNEKPSLFCFSISPTIILFHNFTILQNLKFFTSLICRFPICDMDLRLHAGQSKY